MERNAGKIWEIQNPDSHVVEEISRTHGVSELTARVLVNRDLRGADEIRSFLAPGFSTLSNPMDMADMEKAARRIIRACRDDERIFIYADYDADGATGAACLYLFLKELFPDLHLYIHQNDRGKDGYGLKTEYIEFAARSGYSLIVTVDSGISNFDEVRKAGELGVDVIVTDHHSVQERLPDALAVLNPKREDCPSDFKDLAGVGVTFSLLCGLRKLLRQDGFFRTKPEPQLAKFLDLVALGTVADLAPLQGDNRVFVRNGLRQINRNPRPGIQALIEIAGIGKSPVNERDLAFRIGPRLNAAGRIGDSMLSSAILVEPSSSRALDLARILSRENRKRQVEEDRTFSEAQAQIEGEGLGERRLIVVGSEKWHIGVIGIVASKIVSAYSKPAIVFTFDGDEAKGSGRSRSPIDILKLLGASSHLIERYGGHPFAAGLMIRRDRYGDFRRVVEDAVCGMYGDDEIVPVIEVDGEVSLEAITMEVVDELGRLGPYGMGNPEPVFLSRNLKVSGVSARGRGVTTFQVSQEDADFEVLSFDRNRLERECLDRIDLLFTPKVSVYRGRNEIKLYARDFRTQ